MTRSMIGMAVAGMVLCTVPVEGQSADSARSAASPTIVLRAEVSAREVRFVKQPEIRVTLVGGDVDSVRVVERRNLSERVQPGVTYRDVFVAVEVIGKLHAECLAAAIGTRLSALGSRPLQDSTTVRPCDAVTGSVRRSP